MTSRGSPILPDSDSGVASSSSHVHARWGGGTGSTASARAIRNDRGEVGITPFYDHPPRGLPPPPPPPPRQRQRSQTVATSSCWGPGRGSPVRSDIAQQDGVEGTTAVGTVVRDETETETEGEGGEFLDMDEGGGSSREWADMRRRLAVSIHKMNQNEREKRDQTSTSTSKKEHYHQIQTPSNARSPSIQRSSSLLSPGSSASSPSPESLGSRGSVGTFGLRHQPGISHTHSPQSPASFYSQASPYLSYHPYQQPFHPVQTRVRDPSALSTYINIDPTGGVGDSPVPSLQQSQQSHSQQSHSQQSHSQQSHSQQSHSQQSHSQQSHSQQSHSQQSYSHSPSHSQFQVHPRFQMARMPRRPSTTDGMVGRQGKLLKIRNNTSPRTEEGREGRERREGNMTPRRTLSQRSSLASLFEKRHGLMRKLSKLGLGSRPSTSTSSLVESVGSMVRGAAGVGAGGGGGGGPKEKEDTANKGGSQNQVPFPTQAATAFQASLSRNPSSRSRRRPSLTITPPPLKMSRVVATGGEAGERRREDDDDDDDDGGLPPMIDIRRSSSEEVDVAPSQSQSQLPRSGSTQQLPLPPQQRPQQQQQRPQQQQPQQRSQELRLQMQTQAISGLSSSSRYQSATVGRARSNSHPPASPTSPLSSSHYPPYPHLMNRPQTSATRPLPVAAAVPLNRPSTTNSMRSNNNSNNTYAFPISRSHSAFASSSSGGASTFTPPRLSAVGGVAPLLPFAPHLTHNRSVSIPRTTNNTPSGGYEDTVDSNYYDILISSSSVSPGTANTGPPSSALSRPSRSAGSTAVGGSAGGGSAGLGGSSLPSTASGPRRSEDDWNRHPYAYGSSTFASGYVTTQGGESRRSQESHKRGEGSSFGTTRRGGNPFGDRLSPIPSYPSGSSLHHHQASTSTPDLRGGVGGVGAGFTDPRRRAVTGRMDASVSENNHERNRRNGIDMSRLRPHVRQKLLFASDAAAAAATVGGGGEKWLSTDIMGILLPRPKFRVKTKRSMEDGVIGRESKGKEKERNQILNRRLSRSLVDLASTEMVEMSEFGVGVKVREDGPRDSSGAQRKSYAYDDLSLLSLERVLEEGEKLGQDRVKWHAQALQSIGNKTARMVSRSRSKSLTQAGRRMMGTGAKGHTQQSSIDYLAARACLGDQDVSPIIGPPELKWLQNGTPVPLRTARPGGGRHERDLSSTSGAQTMVSAAGRTSFAHSSQPSQGHASVSVDGHPGHPGHKRNESWSRSALRVVKSLPQLCGIMPEDEKSPVDVQPQEEPQQKQQTDTRGHHGLEEALKNDTTRVIKFEDPATIPAIIFSPVSLDTGGIDIQAITRQPSPASSRASAAGVVVGIAISTPPPSEPQEIVPVYRPHPFAIGADRVDISARLRVPEASSVQTSSIRLPDHPYAQSGLLVNVEGAYAGPHPASSAMAPEFIMANLGFSGVSARHRLPPQVALAQNPHSRQNSLTRQDGGLARQGSLGQQQQSQGPMSQESGVPTQYVMVEDTRNSYQDLRPYLRVDSDVPPPDRLWVTYSPGNVREVMPNEVFQYSPYMTVPEGDTAKPEEEEKTVTGEPDAGPRRRGDEDGLDFFLQRYKRMSTVYQDTASMSEVLANAMYDAADERMSALAESIDSGRGMSEEQPSRGGGHLILDLPETIVVRKTSSASHGTPTTSKSTPGTYETPPTLHIPQRHGSTWSLSRISSPILPRPTPADFPPPAPFTTPPPGTSHEHSASSSPPTSPVPRVGSPDNLEPFRNLFYKPPDESETESLPSPLVPPVEDPSNLLDNLRWSAEGVPNGRTNSGLMALMKQMTDELEQIAQERHQLLGGGSARTSKSRSQYSQSSGFLLRASSSGGHAANSQVGSHMSSEAGPLHFVLEGSPGQESSQTGYIPRPDHVPSFYPTNPIPEDIDSSRAPSPFEGSVEEVTVRLPSVPVEILSGPTTTSSSTQSESQLSYVPAADATEELLPPQTPFAASISRASYTTTSSLSRMSSLSAFPTPPHMITPEEMSLLNAHRDDNNTVTSSHTLKPR